VVEAYARNHKIPIQWAEKGVRKEDFVRPYLKKMEKQNRLASTSFFQSMEQGTTFRSTAPKYPTTTGPRILAPSAAASCTTTLHS